MTENISLEAAKTAAITLGLNNVNDPKGMTGVNKAFELAFSQYVNASTRAENARILLDFVESHQSGGVAFQHDAAKFAAQDLLGKYADQQEEYFIAAGAGASRF